MTRVSPNLTARSALWFVAQAGIILACEVLNTVAFNALIAPARLLDSGVAGLALLLNQIAGLPLGAQIFLYNIPIFLLGYRFLGRRFVALSLVGVLSFAFLLDNVQLPAAIRFPALTDDLLLVAIFGGILTGIADGLILRVGGSTGGLDIVNLIFSRYSGLPLGQIFIVLNGLIIGIGALASRQIETAMYTLILLFVQANVIDTILSPTPRRTVLIVSTRAEAVADRIMKDLSRGATFLTGEGAYTGQGFRVLMCVLTRYEMVDLRIILREVDPDAFTTVMDTTDVIGHFSFYSPLRRWRK